MDISDVHSIELDLYGWYPMIKIKNDKGFILEEYKFKTEEDAMKALGQMNKQWLEYLERREHEKKTDT